jgi:putative hydrolase of the HAD superfamily
METVIDMTEIPGEKEYALWAYDGSGVEHYWDDQEEFISQFQSSRQIIRAAPPLHKEYDIEERFRRLIQLKQRTETINTEYVIRSLIANYWRNYKERCYVKPEVISVLNELAIKHDIGLVSNFIVRGGVEELLKQSNLLQFFSSIVVSVDVGWRKPHPYIYQKVLDLSGIQGDQAIFIGDDYQNDYEAPQNLGIRTLLYDPNNRHGHVGHRFTSFLELSDILQELK